MSEFYPLYADARKLKERRNFLRFYVSRICIYQYYIFETPPIPILAAYVCMLKVLDWLNFFQLTWKCLIVAEDLFFYFWRCIY